MVDPTGEWRANAGRYWERGPGELPAGALRRADPVDCFSAEQFIKHVFLDSDTELAVLSFVPELPEHNPLSLEEAERVRVLVERMEGAHRLFLHAMVVPNAPAHRPLELMEEADRRYPIAAWKCYTQWGPDGVGWELDSPDVGIPFIEQARELGVRNICIHKGLLFPGFPEALRALRRRRPGGQALPGHELHHLPLGLRDRHREGPFDPDQAERGVDMLIKSLLDNGIGPNGNVYAELGSTWRFVMRDPDHGRPSARQAADARRRGQRALGHRFDLVRLAAGPDPGVPQLPDRARADRAARLPDADARAQGQGVRPERRARLRRRGAASASGPRSIRSASARPPIASRRNRPSRPSGRRPTASSRRCSRSATACRPDTRSMPIAQGMVMTPTQGSRWALHGAIDPRSMTSVTRPATAVQLPTWQTSTPADGGSRAAAGSTAA